MIFKRSRKHPNLA